MSELLVALGLLAFSAFVIFRRMGKKSAPKSEVNQSTLDFGQMTKKLPANDFRDFMPTIVAKVGPAAMPVAIALDEDRQEFIVVDRSEKAPRFYRGPWSKIRAAEVRQNQQVIAHTKGIGAVVGGVAGAVIAGPAGAIVGAVAGRKRSETSAHTDTDLYILLDDLRFPSIKLPFGRNDKEAFEWMSRIETVIWRAATSEGQVVTIEQ